MQTKQGTVYLSMLEGLSSLEIRNFAWTLERCGPDYNLMCIGHKDQLTKQNR